MSDAGLNHGFGAPLLISRSFDKSFNSVHDPTSMFHQSVCFYEEFADDTISYLAL